MTYATDVAQTDILQALRDAPVSRFEWGLERFRNALVESFRVDPVTLAPSVPPFFINVNFDRSANEILVEVGRTFGTTEETRAKQFCEDYLLQIRSLVAVDRLGRPVSNGTSTLAADFFMPVDTPQQTLRETGGALDKVVKLRGLVVAPASGIYAVCGVQLVGGTIKHLE